jgi:hypothetical protein
LALSSVLATITIGGTSYNSNVIDYITIDYGRTQVWEQARASYAKISLYNPDNADWSFDLMNTVVIKVKNASGTDRTIFTGKINSIDGSMSNIGVVRDVARVEITAYGPFADMNRRNIGGSAYPRELDSVRMTRIFNDAGVTISTVDSPGIYELANRSALTSNAYSMAVSYATQSFGYIYETTGFQVGFANESRRTTDVAANGYYVIPTNYINGYSLASTRSANDVINSVFLTYATGDKSASSSGSITTYGTRAANITTELHNATDATTQANRYLALQATPQTNIEAFSLSLLNPNVSNAAVDVFLQINMGKAIQINGLPYSIIDTSFDGFIEGWTWNITRKSIDLSVRATNSILSLTPTRWQDVSAALAWNAVSPTLQWANYS